ncbi:PucR family transcriptional regulator [Streptomyces sp. NPDC001941]|uniref:PucR family transcriptional regulator n=1 Tax=Streptomyces sp. NPDC001941 TaxID=3154659 RepID=UPI00332EBAA6
MHVEHLLSLDRLDLGLVWGDPALLGQEISGVTATDLEDPTRFLQPGEIVLSGLVWWSPDAGPAKTDRFVAALRDAGAVALLAGEETHGEVPHQLADACRTHRIALLSVPAHTSFRAITEAVYLRQWGELSRRPTGHWALPENVRAELERALDRGAPAADLLDRAFAHLGTPACHLLTSSGRTLARTAGTPRLSPDRGALALRGDHGATLRVDADDTVFDAWHLHVPEAGTVPPRVLQEIADLLGRHRRREDRRRAPRDQAHAELARLTGAAHPDPNALEAALRTSGLPAEGPYTVAVAAGDEDAAAALAEALRHATDAPRAVAALPGGEALAVIADTGVRDALARAWPLVQECRPAPVLHAGLGHPVRAAAHLGRALAQARHALAAARATGPDTAAVADLGAVSTLGTLLAGVPDDVRTAYRETVLGPLLKEGRASHAMLRETLEVFLAHDCSWARTAEALHLHVNTVHYRIQRVETLTSRDLSRLDHRLDLRAALLCG